MSQGMVFLQVVSPGPKPVSYAKANPKRIAHIFTNAVTNAKAATTTNYHGTTGTSGLSNGVEFVMGTLPASTYNVSVLDSSSTFSFLVRGVPVIGARTTVVRFVTNGSLQLKPQTFLLVN